MSRLRFWLWPAGLLLASMSSALPRLRLDFPASLGQRLCQSSRALSPSELWQLGVYDSQIQVAWIEAPESIDSADLDAAARREAEAALHRSYAFGHCGERRAWILSSPAPGVVFQAQGNEILIRSTLLQGVCKHFDLDAAAAEDGLPRSIAKGRRPSDRELTLNPAFLKAGTLSVTCHPPNGAIRGPELWALMPIGRWNLNEVPAFQEAQHQDAKGLKQWIADLRLAHHLKPLNKDKALLKRFARDLLGETSIRHPRALLLNQASELGRKKGKFLGENRVKGANAKEMAWLLWHSPQHRRLLLNPEANAIGLELARFEREEMAVMVLARL